tara:strand:- start:192 stop:395 length:204 start_codon:yes stop_codon:yes gene_type:complete
MGRAISMERDVHILKKEVEQLKSAFEGLASTVETLEATSTAKTHIDLHETPKKKKKSKVKLVEEAEA